MPRFILILVLVLGLDLDLSLNLVRYPGRLSQSKSGPNLLNTSGGEERGGLGAHYTVSRSASFLG